jgi:hypothetical protein
LHEIDRLEYFALALLALLHSANELCLATSTSPLGHLFQYSRRFRTGTLNRPYQGRRIEGTPSAKTKWMRKIALALPKND